MAEPFLRDPVVLTPDQALEAQPGHVTGQLQAGQAPTTLVLTNSASLRDLFLEVLEVDEPVASAGPAPVYVSQEFQGAGVSYPGIGAPVSAMTLEKCIAAGTRRVLYLGLAGAIAPQADAGEACLVTGSIPHDGVTSHYAGPGYRPEPDAGLTRTLEEATELDRSGVVWTTAAPYRETVDTVDRYREEGVMAVDMETSAVLTVAAYREVPAGAMVVTTDVLREHTWEPCPEGAADDGVRRAVRGMVSLLKGLRNLS